MIFVSSEKLLYELFALGTLDMLMFVMEVSTGKLQGRVLFDMWWFKFYKKSKHVKTSANTERIDSAVSKQSTFAR